MSKAKPTYCVNCKHLKYSEHHYVAMAWRNYKCGASSAKRPPHYFDGRIITDYRYCLDVNTKLNCKLFKAVST